MPAASVMTLGDEPKARSWSSPFGCAWKAHTGLPGASAPGGYVTGGRFGHLPSTEMPAQPASSAIEGLFTQSPVSAYTRSFKASTAGVDQTAPPIADAGTVSNRHTTCPVLASRAKSAPWMQGESWCDAAP